MIRSVIRIVNDNVIVFNERGRQMPDYEGRYKDVRERILRDAPADARFWHDDGRRLNQVEKAAW